MSNPAAIPLTPELAEALLRLVQDAGRAIMAVYDRAVGDPASAGVRRKADDSPLTEADLEAHRVLAAGLALLTPGIPVVSEEDEASWIHRRAEGRFWLIDPLDGTKEFVARTRDFTVNLALVVDGRAVFGVVGAPALDLLYWTAPAGGAFRLSAQGRERIRVAPGPEDEGRPWRVVASRSHLDEATLRFVEDLHPYELVRVGSSLKFCRVAEGEADCYPRLGPTCEWDTAAAQAVVEAAGGQVCTLDGNPLRYGKPEVLNPFFVVRAR